MAEILPLRRRAEPDEAWALLLTDSEAAASLRKLKYEELRLDLVAQGFAVILASERRRRASDAKHGQLPDQEPYSTDVKQLRIECEAWRSKMAAGGYHIWSPVDALPHVLRVWAEGEGAALLRSALKGSPRLRCMGGAALWKVGGQHSGTPFHQDKAYEERGATPGRKYAVWLALSSADAASGCLRFAPSLGFALRPHETLPREDAPSGFETFLVDSVEAAAAAVDCEVGIGDAILIGDSVVHGSHSAGTGETRLAFSAIYQVVD